MTVDEARARLGRQFAQKSTEEPQEAVQKSAAIPALLDTANFGMPPFLPAIRAWRSHLACPSLPSRRRRSWTPRSSRAPSPTRPQN